jgi:antitoxin component of RelBE/YafQ-DinJ toxin-antitoxin module
MSKVGLTPATVLSMVYAEIARTGKIPVSTEVSEDDLNTAKLIALSHNIPSVKVSDTQSTNDFLEDDGGYYVKSTLLGLCWLY